MKKNNIILNFKGSGILIKESYKEFRQWSINKTKIIAAGGVIVLFSVNLTKNIDDDDDENNKKSFYLITFQCTKEMKTLRTRKFSESL